MPSLNSPDAICMRHLTRYCIGGVPTRSVKRSASTERDSPACLANSSIVQLCAGAPCMSDNDLPTNGSRRHASHPACSGGRASAPRKRGSQAGSNPCSKPSPPSIPRHASRSRLTSTRIQSRQGRHTRSFQQVSRGHHHQDPVIFERIPEERNTVPPARPSAECRWRGWAACLGNIPDESRSVLAYIGIMKRSVR